METVVGIKDLLDVLPKWLEFVLRFPVDPERALCPYIDKGTISKELTWLAVAGTAISYLFFVIAPPPLTAGERESRIVRTFQKIDIKLFPVSAIFISVAVAVVIHLQVKLCLALVPASYWGKINWGTIEDTVNAVLGFASFMIPYYTLTFLLGVRVLSLSENGERKGPIALALLIIFTASMAFVVYLPMSLAAVHGTEDWLAIFFIICAVLTVGSVIYFAVEKWKKNA